MDKLVNYIITWLCYGDEEAAKRVAYTDDEKALETHDVIIVPNGHLGKDFIIPELKKPVVEQPSKDKSIIRTDIVYAVFFFTSRAEELLNPQRDEHGRFAARFSVLHQKSRLQIPRLDEYARLVLKQLQLPLPEPGFGHIYLTHDIDAISKYRSLRSALGGIKRGEAKQVWASLKDIHNDPYYTFPPIPSISSNVRTAKGSTIPNTACTDGISRTSNTCFGIGTYTSVCMAVTMVLFLKSNTAGCSAHITYAATLTICSASLMPATPMTSRWALQTPPVSVCRPAAPSGGSTLSPCS